MATQRSIGGLVAVLLAVLFVVAGSTAAAPAASFAAPCELRLDINIDCVSSQPTVILDQVAVSNTVGCVFSWTIDWGDQTPEQAVSFNGGGSGASSVANHTYAAPGAYQIAVVAHVLSGSCVAGGASFRFTLSDTSPCVLVYPYRTQCQSTDPNVITDLNMGNGTTGCSFTVDIDWGDHGPLQNVVLDGRAAGSVLLAKHAYAAPGDYKIIVAPHVLAGACTVGTAVFDFTRSAPTPTPTPVTAPATVSPTASATPTPKLAAISPTAAFTLPPASKCLSRRSLTVRVRRISGVTFVKAVIKVRGKTVKTVTRSRIASNVSLTGLPKGTFKLSITAYASDGRHVSSTRQYRTCAGARAA